MKKNYLDLDNSFWENLNFTMPEIHVEIDISEQDLTCSLKPKVEIIREFKVLPLVLRKLQLYNQLKSA